MPAAGKTNASRVQKNDRIIVQVSELSGNVTPSGTKTGDGVQVARVIGKTAINTANYGRRTQRWYQVETTAGTFEAAPIQTMWLAPEDAAGVKRAHVEALAEQGNRWKAGMDEILDEALAEDAERDAATPAAEEFTPGERAELAADFKASGALDDAHAEALTLHSQAGKVDNMDNDTSIEAETTSATPENHTGSTVVSLLEKVWARIRADHPELPEVVIITGSGLIGASKWGHFRAEGWKVKEEGAAIRKHELFLAGEALAKGATQVLQTMLHEAAHTLAKVRGEQDTSRQGRWHNATFRKMAEEMGLEHKATKADKTHGFSGVTLTAATKERYADLLAELDREIRLVCHLPVWLGGEADQDEERGGEKIGPAPKGEGETKPQSGPLKAVCGCEEPLIIRLSQKVLDLGVVKCTECDELFTAA
jgi:hypothetical protein